MIHFPDFRSYERAYQLITQVSGRAGRRDKPGSVVIQTSSPDHALLQTILRHNFDEFYQSQIQDRYHYHYPPFSRLVEITVKHTDKKSARTTATELTEALRKQLDGIRILGPGEPMISKIRNQFLMSTLIKIPRTGIDLANIKTNMLTVIESISKQKEHRNSRIIVDVDPV
jgi:primosomal protein N' (replication factor Y)